MSESLSITTEPIGHMFGLFGCDTAPNGEEIVEQVIQTNEELIQSCETLKQIAEEINENHCLICKSLEIRYRCPKCETKTCSLSCCRRHKTKYNCNGIRDKTSFVKISDFSQQDFLSDYFFLEDVDRSLDNSCRERRSIISSKSVLPKWIQKLVREARIRGTYLKIMPAGFQRRKQNSTCFMYSQNVIHWDIELIFVHTIDPKDKQIETIDQTVAEDLVFSHSELSFIEKRVCETTKLSDLLSKYIDSNDLMENNERNRKLLLYRNNGLNNISVLFRTENRGSNQRKYIELDFNETLKHNLKGKTVIEFPTLLVVLNQFKHSFDMILTEESNKRQKTD